MMRISDLDRMIMKDEFEGYKPFEVDGIRYVLIGGSFTASGVETYIRPFENVREAYENNDLDHYSRTGYDVVLKVYNDTLHKYNLY